MDFPTFFEHACGFQPHPWQARLGESPSCEDHLIRIPTGFGKTVGVVAPWLYHAVVRGDPAWPRRLAFVLPMRVLVEQTVQSIRDLIAAAGLDVPVQPAMGGAYDGEWALSPERPAVLVGTQDMLLSRALNRGYGAARGRWPMDFGLLHHDTLWVLDEVQLMDVGLVTSVQLAACRDHDAANALRPCRSWWMSATLQATWLDTKDYREQATALAQATLSIPAEVQQGGLWEVTKQLHRSDDDSPAAVASLVLERHQPGALSLVIVNRVQHAVEVYDALAAALGTDRPDLHLVHSRFRGAERKDWAASFLHRGASIPAAGRIVVATQVVEAGVDISAGLLVTSLAPWSSLVQRFGRAARYQGQQAEIHVLGAAPESDKDALPYDASALAAAAESLGLLADGAGSVSPRALDAHERALAAENPELLARLYAYSPLHVLRRPDLLELFGTDADLSGADLDVSRYIRTGEERDVTVFWAEVDATAREIDISQVPLPAREALCPVPVGQARAWLAKGAAWRFDYLDGVWRKADVRRLVPGLTLLVPCAAGGYVPRRGWDPKAKGPVVPVTLLHPADQAQGSFDLAAAAAGRDDLSAQATWKTIATHGAEVAEEVRALAATLGLPAELTELLALAARLHDLGKAHPVFQQAIDEPARHASLANPSRQDLAKAPAAAWRRPAYPERPGFRHELASGLALLAVLRQAEPDHGALRGAHRELLEALGLDLDAAPRDLADHPLGRELATLDPEQVDLLLYLVVAHHGKVRTSLGSTEHDRDGNIHGVATGDPIPAIDLLDASGVLVSLPPLTLDTAPASLGVDQHFGSSWSERVGSLLARHGPFRLAFLEAILRIADVRASRLTSEDPRL